jgi:hypothetical protein
MFKPVCQYPIQPARYRPAWHRAWLVASLCVGLLTGCASQAPPAPPRPLKPASLADFSGSWEIDYANTEDPMERLRYLYDIARSQYDQQLRRRDDGRGARPADSSALRDIEGIMKLGELADAVTQSTILTIDQSDEHISIKRSGDYALTCDFLAPVNALSIGQETCGLDNNGQLIFAARLPEGLTLINRYSLAKGSQTFDNKRLMVSTSLRSEKLSKPFNLNRVYMLFPPGEGQYECTYTLGKKKTCSLGTGDE